jgi:pyridoxine 5'-phosphate synthase PdxJ
MKRVRPKQLPLRPDGRSMTDDEFRALHDQIAAFDDVEWIDDDMREIVEHFMPDLVDKLPDRRTETFDQAFGRTRAAALRKHPKRIRKSAIERAR